jgi:hypothetical protein
MRAQPLLEPPRSNQEEQRRTRQRRGLPVVRDREAEVPIQRRGIGD